MIDNKRYFYDPDKSPRGLECAYWKDGDTMYIEIPGSNSVWDWVVNIFGSLVTKKLYDYDIPIGWYYMAFRFFRILKPILVENKIKHIRIRGHSLGGAIGAILQMQLLRAYKYPILRAYGSPNCGLRHSVHVNRGDIIPFLPFWGVKSKKIKSHKKWAPVWKSHHDYDWRFKYEDFLDETIVRPEY